MSGGGQGGESAPNISIARVDSKLVAIQERIALLQSNLKECRSPEQRQYLQAELAFAKTRKMVCQKHRGVLVQAMMHGQSPEARSTYTEMLIGGALKLFQRWTAPSSAPTETAPDQESLIETVEGEVAATARPTLRKRNMSNSVSSLTMKSA